MEKILKTLPVGQIKPYERNPRKNDIAVDDVAESIRQTGYIAPIIIDENGEILAGHTRFKALKKLGKAEVEVLQVTGLTEEQKRKYRLLDNKTGEVAVWDFDLLDWELEDLDFEGYDFGFNIPQTAEDVEKELEQFDFEKNSNTVICPNCGTEFIP